MKAGRGVVATATRLAIWSVRRGRFPHRKCWHGEKIEAVIKHFKTEPVKEALMAAGVERLTLNKIKGFGRRG